MELSVSRYVFAFQQRLDLFNAFFIAGSAFFDTDIELFELDGQECARKTDFQPTVRKRIQHAKFSRDFQGIVEHRQHGTRDHLRLLRPLSRGSQKHDRICAVAAIGMKVVFDRAHVGVAQFVHQATQMQSVCPVGLRRLFVRRAAGEKIKAEFH